MDTPDTHMLIGELTGEMRGLKESIDRLHDDFQCVPQRLHSLEEWRDATEDRRKSFAKTKAVIGGSVVAVAAKGMWDWAAHLFSGPGPGR